MHRFGYVSMVAGLLGSVVMSAPGRTDVPLRHVRTVVLDESAWYAFNTASFDQDKIVSSGEFQYTPFWDADKVLVIARRRIGSDEVQTLRLEDHHLTINPRDGHRNTVVGISPVDGRVHLSWDHHCNPLRYTKSREGILLSPPPRLSQGDFEPAQPLLADDKLESRVTYPRFLNDGAGTLYFIYRQGASGRGDNYIHRYDAKTGGWRRMGKSRWFSQRGTYGPWERSTSRNAYLNDVLFDSASRLHVTWTYREAGRTWASNHDLHYAYSDDGGVQWRNNAGKPIADLDAGDSIELADPGIVVWDIPVFSWLMNQTTMVLDSRNQPHVITFHLPKILKPEKLKHGPPASARPDFRMFHYWRAPDGTWHGGNTGVPLMSRPGVIFDAHDNMVVYHAAAGKLQLHYSVADSSWGTWTSRALTIPDVQLVAAGKPDRRLASSRSVLSFPVVIQTGDKQRGFAIVDFE